MIERETDRERSMRPKAQSAPADRGGGTRHNWLSKSNSGKEIEQWARAGRELSNTERNSGQLTDNVTEERMLNSRLLDLGKERHKFISQREYEMKIFLDRQTRKSTIFKELIQTIAPGGKLSRSSMRSRSSTNARMQMLDRFDPTKNKKNPSIGDTSKMSSEDSLANAIVKLPERRHSFSETRPICQSRQKAPGKTFPTESKLDKNCRLLDDEPLEAPETSTHRDLFPKLQTTTASVQIANQPTPTLRKNSTLTLGNQRSILMDRETRRSKKGHVRIKEASPSRDPRYVRLEHSLSEAYGPMDGYTVDLPLIITQIGSLHVPPVYKKNAKKPGITNKIQKFMAEKGIIF